MAQLYRWQAPLFDLTRWPVLLGRHRLARQLHPARRLVEVGCGTGHNLAPLHRAAGASSQVVGVECAPGMAQRARRRCRRVTAIEIRELEYGPQTVGPCDAAVFSYSLSMIPDYLSTLERIHADLLPGGQILVLDFVDSPPGPVQWAMRRMGVELGEDRWTALRQRFTVRHETSHRAFGGLWRYRLLVAERPFLASPHYS